MTNRQKNIFSSYNPWGNGPSNRPSSEENGFLKQLNDAVKKVMPKKNGSESSPPSGGKILLALPLLFFGVWIFSGFYQVLEGEIGVVLRFGKVSYETNPGLRYHIPYPVETVIVHNISEIKLTDSVLERNKRDNDNEQSLILTGDENMVQTNYTVRWKINNIQQYLFNVRNSEKTIQIVAESVIREILGQTTAREALTKGRDQVGAKSQELLQKLIDKYQMGIQVISLQLQRVAPPAQVIKAFNDMQASVTDSETIQNEAKAYRNDLLPKARGDAASLVQSAEGYRTKVITEAEGEASRLQQLLAVFKKNPTAYTQLYFETLASILKNSKTIILDSKISQNVLPHLMLNKKTSSPLSSAKKDTPLSLKQSQIVQKILPSALIDSDKLSPLADVAINE